MMIIIIIIIIIIVVLLFWVFVEKGILSWDKDASWAMSLWYTIACTVILDIYSF